MLNTFNDVKNWYERTTPLRGKKNEGLDIRPLDNRRHKDTRIIKVDDNCYALSDGYHFGDPLNMPYDYGAGFNPTPQDTATHAPVVWRIEADGTETVAVRNGGNFSSTVLGRHRLLRKYLPRGIILHTAGNTGKHYLQCASGTHYLPKATMLPKQVYGARATANAHWGKPTLSDQATLLFRREGDVFLLASAAPVETKRVVNKALKEPFRKPIAEFQEWMGVILPMLNLTTNELRQHRTTFKTACNHGDLPGLIREILLDPTHESRIDMAATVLAETTPWPWGSVVGVEPGLVSDAIKSLNGWINRYGEFMHEVPK